MSKSLSVEAELILTSTQSSAAVSRFKLTGLLKLTHSIFIWTHGIVLWQQKAIMSPLTHSTHKDQLAHAQVITQTRSNRMQCSVLVKKMYISSFSFVVMHKDEEICWFGWWSDFSSCDVITFNVYFAELLVSYLVNGLLAHQLQIYIEFSGNYQM